jgi:hypothetical protein
VGEPYQKLFYPKATNKALLRRISALPTLKPKELNEIVGFRGGMSVTSTGDFVVHRAPGIEWKKDVILMEVPAGAKYTPPSKDIVEILESEYLRLSADKRKPVKS